MQSVTCAAICLDCWCVRCEFRRYCVQDRLIESSKSFMSFSWKVSEVNHSTTECFIECWTHLLCLSPDPLHKPCQYATCDERKGTNCGCQLLGSSTALRCWVMRGREVTCSYAVFPAYSSCKQTIQQNFVDVLLGT